MNEPELNARVIMLTPCPGTLPGSELPSLSKRSQENREGAEPGSPPDPQHLSLPEDHDEVSSATNGRDQSQQQAHQSAENTSTISQASDPIGGANQLPCPIMGKVLPTRQWEKNYPPEALFPASLLAFPDMAKMLPEQEPEAIRALRANTTRLRAGRSFRSLVRDAKLPETIGRSINNLETPGHKSGVDIVAAAAAALKLEIWQMFIPSAAELTPEERSELARLVRAFMASDAMRRSLIAQVDLNSPKVDEVHKKNRR